MNIPASNAVHEEFFNNYDYYWLKYSMIRGAAENACSLLVGHSLSRFGINDRDIPGLINLSFFSQDYYYSLKIIKKALAKIPSLKHIILGTGYISAYMDLSRAQSRNELERIVRVYGRYFQDIHNMDPKVYKSIKEDVFPGDRESVYHTREEELLHLYETIKDDYFCSERSRQSLLEIAWKDSIPEAERFYLAGKRTNFHNKLLSYRDNYEENARLLQEIARLCHAAGAKLVLVVFPANQYYRHTLDPRLKESFMRQIHQIPEAIRPPLWDLCASPEFNSITDFADTDHLSDSGAAKMTAMMKDYLEEFS